MKYPFVWIGLTYTSRTKSWVDTWEIVKEFIFYYRSGQKRLFLTQQGGSGRCASGKNQERPESSDFGCIGTVDSGPKCAHSKRSIIFFCHIHCAHLCPRVVAIVTASSVVSNRESRYPRGHRETNCTRNREIVVDEWWILGCVCECTCVCVRLCLCVYVCFG